MVRKICLLMCSLGFAFSAYAEMGADYCSGEAWQIAQANGGDQVTMTYSSVDGWGVNARGYASYSFMRGNEKCSIPFDVYGTYFGVKCSNDWGVSCSGDRARRHRR